MKLPAGKLIAFEGVDGSGKTTQVRNLARRLVMNEIDATAVAYSDEDWFRNAYRRQSPFYDPNVEVDFFAWAFNTLVERRIKPLLSEHDIVIADRYSLSYFAYQSYHRISQQALAAKLTSDAPVPNLTVILDIPRSIAVERCRERRDGGPLAPPFNLSDDRLAHVIAYYRSNLVDSMRFNGQGLVNEISAEIWQTVTSRLKVCSNI